MPSASARFERHQHCTGHRREVSDHYAVALSAEVAPATEGREDRYGQSVHGAAAQSDGRVGHSAEEFVDLLIAALKREPPEATTRQAGYYRSKGRITCGSWSRRDNPPRIRCGGRMMWLGKLRNNVDDFRVSR